MPRDGKAPVRLFADQPVLCLLTFVMPAAPSVMQQQLVSQLNGERGQAWKITGILPARFGETDYGRIFVLVTAKGELRQGWEPNR